MRAPRPIALLAAGIAVYGAVAACSAAGTTSAGQGRDGGPGAIVGALVDAAHAAVDALANPVPTASAAPLPLQVDVEPCNVEGANGVLYAEHAYPGRSAAELSATRAIVSPAGQSYFPPGYVGIVGNTVVRDGSAAVQCGIKSQPAPTVTFVFQPL